MPISVNGANGITFADGSIQNTGAAGFGYKNRVMNGDMRITQRGTSSIPVDNGAWYYPADRFAAYQSVASSKYTIQQNAGSVTPPPGFKYYIGATVTSAYSPTSTDWFPIRHTIEGYNWADFQFGSATAQTFTASFWVRSSLTGTLGGAFYNNNGTRSYPFTYTISSANTWEFKTITVVGDTSGTWNSTNEGGITIQWSMGGGSTYTGTAGAWASAFYVTATGATHPVATNGATLYIAGVQIEKGSTATAFDYRPIGLELFQCQRYYERLEAQSQFWVPNGGYLNYLVLLWQFRVPKRTAPTLSTISGVTATLDSYGQGGVGISSSAADSATQYSARLNFVLTGNQSLGTNITLTNTFFQANAEL